MPAASHQAPISTDALTSMIFGQRPENGGKPATARNSASDTKAKPGAML